jgi:hypothetical protein
MKKFLIAFALFAYPLFAELTVSQIEEMVKRIQSKRVSEYEIDFLKIPSPLDGISKVVDKNVTKTVLLESTKDINFVLNAIVNDNAYINGKWYKKGDVIQGFTLREIFDDHVILKKDRKTVKVYLVKKKDLKIKLTTGDNNED